MRLSNKYGYPEAVLKAVEADGYTKGDSEFSATGLLQPPRIRVLQQKHESEISVDIDERLFALYGQLGHALLERAGISLGNRIIEKRFFGEVSGVRISAQIDALVLQEDGTLQDYKFTSVYGFKKGQEPKWEYRAQMNIQLELMRQNALDAKRMQIIGLLRDWRPGEAKKDKNYPNKIAIHEIPIEPREKTIQFIKDRIKAHKDAEVTLPDCSEHDHWGWRRCEGGYCPVTKFCKQFQDRK